MKGVYFTIQFKPGIYRVLAKTESGITYARSVFVRSLHLFSKEVMEHAQFYDSLDDVLSGGGDG
jgi:hypothetical protein